MLQAAVTTYAECLLLLTRELCLSQACTLSTLAPKALSIKGSIKAALIYANDLLLDWQGIARQ